MLLEEVNGVPAAESPLALYLSQAGFTPSSLGFHLRQGHAARTRCRMPEGDTIFRAARTLHRALAGKPVVRFETVLAQLSRVDDDSPIAGRTVERVRSVGKHLLVEFSGDLVLRTHMRMNGSWHIYRPGERWQRPRSAMRVVVETADFQAVAFDVPVAEFRTARALARDPAVAAARTGRARPGVRRG